MRLPGFAPGHRHAFVLRGRETRGPLFKPGAIPRERILERMQLAGGTLHLARQVHGSHVLEVPPSLTPAGRAASGGGAVRAASMESSTGRRSLEDTPSGGGARDGGSLTSGPQEADALVARARGHVVGVATADCLPILLASGDGACAAVHAGWRGLIAG